jgi:hypothetical protein
MLCPRPAGTPAFAPVAATFQVGFLLYVVIPTEAALRPTRDLLLPLPCPSSLTPRPSLAAPKQMHRRACPPERMHRVGGLPSAIGATELSPARKGWETAPHKKPPLPLGGFLADLGGRSFSSDIKTASVPLPLAGPLLSGALGAPKRSSSRRRLSRRPATSGSAAAPPHPRTVSHFLREQGALI